MPLNSSLSAAKTSKQDEFYTQLSDIDKELIHYTEHLSGKVIYCNCDDPRTSNFFNYLSNNFTKLGLKWVIASSRDFRSAEAVMQLHEADIVVTNPPFSLFREYVAQLIEHNKKFVIIGNLNALSYREIFGLVMENKIWLGHNSGDMAFRVPSHYEPRDTRYWVDADGHKWRSLGNACWFTNLDTAKRHKEIILHQHYHPEKYPTYTNCDAIEVDKTADIPVDYDGAMGVPLTFLTSHNPDQFEILGSSRTLARPMAEVAAKGTYSNGGRGRFYLANGDGSYRRLYDRIVIQRRRKP